MSHKRGNEKGKKTPRKSCKILKPHREALDAFVLARGDCEFAVLASTCATFAGLQRHPWSSLVLVCIHRLIMFVEDVRTLIEEENVLPQVENPSILERRFLHSF